MQRVFQVFYRGGFFLKENEGERLIKRVILLFLSAFFVLPVLNGCGGLSGPSYSLRGEDTGRIRKLAVLPFYNRSRNSDAGDIVTNIFVSELFKDSGYLVEEPGNIRQFFIQEQVEKLGEIGVERLKILGKRLRVDAVLLGTVDVFDDRRGVPSVGINARIVESGSGRLVWTAEHERRGDDYAIIFEVGTVRTPARLAQKVVKEMISTIEW